MAAIKYPNLAPGAVQMATPFRPASSSAVSLTVVLLGGLGVGGFLLYRHYKKKR